MKQLYELKKDLAQKEEIKAKWHEFYKEQGELQTDEYRLKVKRANERINSIKKEINKLDKELKL